MELTNTHTHTDFVAHAQGSVAELVAAADNAGITTLAITEHFPLTDAFDPRRYISMPPEKLDEYCETVQMIRADYPHMEIILGTEMDWLGKHEDRLTENTDLSRFEVVLGSVHFVDTWAFDNAATQGYWDEVGADAIWLRYFEIWIEAVLSDKPFTIMSHPDLPKKFGHYPDCDMSKIYKDAAEAARVSGRMIEVNTSGLYYAGGELYPGPAFLSELRKAEVPCTIGTDAHKPEHVTRGLSEGYKHMYDCGYREVTVPTVSRERRHIAL